MDTKQSQKENVINENKGRGLFYGIIAIATFIIMAVGATFAYFTATTNSMNSTVKTGSTTLQLDFISYGDAWLNKKLIPVDTAVVEYSFEYQDDTTLSTTKTNGDATKLANTLCRDDFGNEICSVYVFQVRNASNSEQIVSINVVSNKNTFGSLNAMIYEIGVPANQIEIDGGGTTENPDYIDYIDHVNENEPTFKKSSDDTDGKFQVVDGSGAPLYSDDNQFTPVYVNRPGVVKTLLTYQETTTEGATSVKPAINRPLIKTEEGDNNWSEPETTKTVKVADQITIPGEKLKTFALVLYILNKDEDQTATDAEKMFEGKVIVKSGDGSSGVSGSIGTVQSDDFDENLLQSNQ